MCSADGSYGSCNCELGNDPNQQQEGGSNDGQSSSTADDEAPAEPSDDELVESEGGVVGRENDEPLAADGPRTREGSDPAGSADVEPPADSRNADDEESFDPRVDCRLFPTNITQDTTIVPDCYRIAASPSFAEDTTLTISPGVTMFVDPGVWIEIPEDVVLRAFGLEAQPIVWQGVEEERGSWGGLFVIGQASLDHVEIKHGGATIPVAAGRARAGLSVDGRLLMSNTLLSENAGYGLRYEPGGNRDEAPLLEGNVITGNESAVLINVWHRWVLEPSLSLSGNDEDTLDISLRPIPTVGSAGSSETISVANHAAGVDGGAWQDLGVPNRMMGGLVVTGSLRVLAGNELRFPPGTGVVVGGEFVTEGFSDSPVVLTADDAGNAWYGIVSCGNGFADLAETQIVGAEGNPSFVASACKRGDGTSTSGIQIAP